MRLTFPARREENALRLEYVAEQPLQFVSEHCDVSGRLRHFPGIVGLFDGETGTDDVENERKRQLLARSNALVLEDDEPPSRDELFEPTPNDFWVSEMKRHLVTHRL